MKFRKKILKILCFIIFLSSIIYCFNNISILEIIKLPKTVYANFNDLQYIDNKKEFGNLIKLSYEDAIKASSNSSIDVKLKLFNLFTIKTFKVNFRDVELYIPGKAIGFTLDGKGLIILGSNPILTENGKEDLLENSQLKKGDIIISIQGENVDKTEDINKIINREENKGKELKVVALRNNEVIETTLVPKLESSTNLYKLGIWVKDSTNGVGTITYVRKDNLRFGALGHPITDNDTKNIFNIKSGYIYNCNIIGLTKGIKGKPGELKGLFLQGKNEQGIVDKNSEYGVYGDLNQDSTLRDSQIFKAGGRFVARPGKAKIRTCIDGNTFKDYDIEIIKTNYQSVSNDKSMVIKVTDKELIKKTGGIVQGMSGSPIIQNGKVVGAITHVFVSDPTKGFGIYLDWMLNE